MKLRLAKTEDAKEILNVYKPFVKNTPITFEYTVPSLKKMTKKIDKISKDYPWIVAEVNGQIAGYAYAYRFRERAAFGWDVESFIYVSEQYGGQGIGTALYAALSDIIKLQGYYNMYALVTSTAKNSLHFHETHGYQPLYTLDQCGWKFDQWYGFVCMRKIIGDFTQAPKDTKSIKSLSNKDIDKILKQYNI